LALIIIHSQPIAIYSAGPQPTTITNPLINFTDNSLGIINDWSWTFGTVGSSTNQNPYFIFPDSGSYAVQLIVTNNFGCTDTTNGMIVIDPIVVFYAPNAFSPGDGNGTNDIFMVKGDGIEYSKFEMTIYNRWGERIFKSSDIKLGWNGRRNNTGVIVEQEVYVWKVNFEDIKGKKHQYIGHVTIVK
jgi:gliding motility-associated-like protein